MMNPMDIRLISALLAIHFVNYSPATSMVMPKSVVTGDFSFGGRIFVIEQATTRATKEEN